MIYKWTHFKSLQLYLNVQCFLYKNSMTSMYYLYMYLTVQYDIAFLQLFQYRDNTVNRDKSLTFLYRHTPNHLLHQNSIFTCVALPSSVPSLASKMPKQSCFETKFVSWRLEYCNALFIGLPASHYQIAIYSKPRCKDSHPH